jgi:hypothetical protein
MNLAEFLPGERSLALYFALTFPAGALLAARSTFMAGFAAIITVVLSAVIVPPAVIIIVSVPHRLAIIVVVALDDGIEPFADRHAGPAGGLARGFACFGAEASEIPRSARFHLRPNHIRGAGWPCLEPWLVNSRCGGRGSLSSGATFPDYSKQVVKIRVWPAFSAAFPGKTGPVVMLA